jgi:alpha-galactosidase
MIATPLRLQLDQGKLTVVAVDTILLRDCCAAVELSDGLRYTIADDALVERTGADALLVRAAGDDSRPELRWSIVPDADGQALRLHVELVNTTDRVLAVERMDVLVAPSGLCAAPLDELQIAQTGWQSWSPATPPVPFSPTQHPVVPPVFAPQLPDSDPERMLAPWMTVLRAPGEKHLLIGFTSAHVQNGVMTIQPTPTAHRWVASAYADGTLVPPGARLRSETLMLIFGADDRAAVQRYAEVLAETMAARPWPHVPTGWCSWYHFFTAVSERDVLRNIAYLAESRARVPVEYIQLDDGYQQQIGDWLTIKDTFPSGMRFLADAIRAQGFKPGIWIAPFLVAATSDVYARHPEWVIRDANGAPLVAIHNWETDNYALDVTHPGAQAWLRQVISTIVHEWGYQYLKIDFVYAAALRGVRHDSRVTGVQAYRQGLHLIRDVAGDDCFVLGCGAPLAPSVGLVDGMRIGPDVATFWRNPPDPDGVERGLHRAVRSTLAHSWMHQRLWTNDPDCLLVREQESRLTLAEVQSWATVIGLSGGMVLLSDDLSRLEPERAALVPLMFPPLGKEAVALPPYVDALPSRIELAVERPWARWLVAALFNWQATAQPLHFDPVAWSLPQDTPYHLFDRWTNEHWGPCTGPMSLPPTPAHGVRLLSVHADRGYPQLIGSTLHLLSGVVELADERWSDERLQLTLGCPGEHTGALAVYVPPQYIYQSGADDVIQHGDLLLITIHLIEHATLTLHFRRREAQL